MKDRINQIKQEALAALSGVKSLAQVDELRIKYLGKKGALTGILRSLGQVAADLRPQAGQMVNDARVELENALQKLESGIKAAEMKARLEMERIDVTMPAKARRMGRLHPLTKVYLELRDIFIGMGFEVREGPEVEYELYNFELLNMPKNHPARDMQDTFYVNENICLRTHTSPNQARVMLTEKPPLRVIVPGRVFRADEVDATHSPIFNQMEGLVIGEGITLADLKGVLDVFAKELYGPQTKTRFRCSYFPFTEPSAEMDVSCSACQGSGCRICKGTGFIEVLGSGMVHPKVLRDCGIDTEKYSGFAFGMGLDRIANLKYGITDIRLLYENDARFLAQL